MARHRPSRQPHFSSWGPGRMRRSSTTNTACFYPRTIYTSQWMSKGLHHSCRNADNQRCSSPATFQQSKKNLPGIMFEAHEDQQVGYATTTLWSSKHKRSQLLQVTTINCRWWRQLTRSDASIGSIGRLSTFCTRSPKWTTNKDQRRENTGRSIDNVDRKYQGCKGIAERDVASSEVSAARVQSYGEPSYRQAAVKIVWPVFVLIKANSDLRSTITSYPLVRHQH